MDTNKANSTSINLQQIVDFLKSSIPTYDEIFDLLETHKGWIPLNEEAITFLSKLTTPWCTLYEDKDRLNALVYHTYFDEEILTDELLSDLLNESTDLLNASDDEFNVFKKEIEQSNNSNDLSPEDLLKAQQESIQAFYVFITQFFNILALMVHRRSMCQLVSDAKNGDDEALCLAVQIDRTVLQLPYFQQRLLKSQFSNDSVFLNKLGSRLRTPILKSKVRYRTLILVFAILEDMNLLDTFTLEKLLDICEEIGVTGKKNGIDDVDKLRKRLHEYKKNVRM